MTFGRVVRLDGIDNFGPTLTLTIRVPLAPADLPGLLARCNGAIDSCRRRPATIECQLVGHTADATVVGALARLQLRAARLGAQVVMRTAPHELRPLIDLMGLTDVLPFADEGGSHCAG